ncbi:MAG: hypothetical protein HOP04_02125 [Methylophilaceae bacterium]|nr:hypothetical protein [Methylophilaceae bacterium]
MGKKQHLIPGFATRHLQGLSDIERQLVTLTNRTETDSQLLNRFSKKQHALLFRKPTPGSEVFLHQMSLIVRHQLKFIGANKLPDTTWITIYHPLSFSVNTISKGLVIVNQDIVLIENTDNDHCLSQPVIETRVMYTDNPATRTRPYILDVHAATWP